MLLCYIIIKYLYNSFKFYYLDIIYYLNPDADLENFKQGVPR